MKPVVKIVLVVVLILAALITFVRNYKSIQSNNTNGINTVKRGQMIWVKCNDPNCKAEYQMDNKDYLIFMESHADPSKIMMAGMNIEDFNEILKSTPALVCQKCKKASAYKAFKCPKCETMFFSGFVRNDYADRCPTCRYSKIEEDRQKATDGKAPIITEVKTEAKPAAK
jgi:hypothetical protein